MHVEFTAIIEPAEEGGFWAICPEVPAAVGQGETIEEVTEDLMAAIEFVLEYQRDKALAEASPAARTQTLVLA